MVDDGGLILPGLNPGGGTSSAVAPPVRMANLQAANPEGFTDL